MKIKFLRAILSDKKYIYSVDNSHYIIVNKNKLALKIQDVGIAEFII